MSVSSIGVRPRPISFICVLVSDEIEFSYQNQNTINQFNNQLIKIDNRVKPVSDTLSHAINAGVKQAENTVIVVMHEDVILPDNWQYDFEHSMRLLEMNDPDWGIVRIVGQRFNGEPEGYWCRPDNYKYGLQQHGFAQVEKIDDQLFVLNNDGRLWADPQLPSIYHIADDLSRTAALEGRRTYVLYAPAILKHEGEGELAENDEESQKVPYHASWTYLADKACSYEYFARKWKVGKEIRECKDFSIINDLSHVDVEERVEILDAPTIFLGRGGSGSRLLSFLAQDLGFFLGNDINASGDTLEMVMSVYQGVIRKYSVHTQWQQDLVVPHLRASAAAMLARAGWPKTWGFKLPECLYLLPELRLAFPKGRYVTLLRDPLTTCLRYPHLTARMDNHIGRIVMPAAYEHFQRSVSLIHHDSPAMNMAITTRHQLDLLDEHHNSILVTKFEKLLQHPEVCLKQFSKWFELPINGSKLIKSVDPQRAARPNVVYPDYDVASVMRFLQPLCARLGYGLDKRISSKYLEIPSAFRLSQSIC